LRATSAIALLACLALAGTAAAAPFDEGERLYRYDKPAEALPYLERAVLEPGANEAAFIYLAGCYVKLNRLDDAVAALRKGLSRASLSKPQFYLWLGDAYRLQNKNSFAVDMFTQAIAADASYSDPYVLRANARIDLKDYKGAREDYARFLELEPRSDKRPSIEAMLAKLDAGIVVAEEAAAAAEAKKAAEEAARKELLEKMAASLKASADETTSLSAGAGDAQGYEHELKLDE
jgi:tetratricopeptide (TPR) repeat protein